MCDQPGVLFEYLRDQPVHMCFNLRHQSNRLYHDLCIPTGVLLDDLRH